MILLDTCVLLWTVNGQRDRLSPPALEAMGRLPWAASALTAWEIGIKHASGKLLLPVGAAEWWAAACARHRVSEVPFRAAVGLAASALPPLHSDPFDRGLVATALVERCALVTPDPAIHRYREIGLRVIW